MSELETRAESWKRDKYTAMHAALALTMAWDVRANDTLLEQLKKGS